jgi:predicted small lipoprotein YifL
MKKSIAMLTSLLALTAITGCGNSLANVDVDKLESAQQEQQLRQAQSQTGLPNIVNYTEKKLAKLLVELRDEQVPTYSYISNQTGLYFICNSVGYGIPYATQVTNPEKLQEGGYTSSAWGTTIPQAEPNGLFMPSAADASWTICSDGKGNIVPVYVEASLVVSPFKLIPTGVWGQTPSIQTKKQLKEVN